MAKSPAQRPHRQRSSGERGRGFGTREIFVLTAPGFEEALADELEDLGLTGRSEIGGVALQAGEKALRDILLMSRVASQVRVRVARGRAENLDDVARVVRAGGWKSFVHPTQPIDVSVSMTGTRFRHRPRVAKKVELAIRDALKGPRLPGPRPPKEPAKVHVRLAGDKIIVSMDASGEPLYKRGWRTDVARAPIRENLAAAILRVADWNPGTPLVDPMCGSGTFAIEAATIALGHAPGAARAFAAERFPCFDGGAMAKARAAAGVGALDEDAPILGGDREEGAILAARKNARRAGVSARIQLEQVTFHELEPPAASGLVVVNPPYGERVGARSKVGAIYRDFGKVMKERWSGWRVAILLPSPRHTGALDLPVEEVAAFKNGSLPVSLFVGQVP